MAGTHGSVQSIWKRKNKKANFNGFIDHLLKLCVNIFLCDILGNSLDCWDNVFLVCCIHSSRRCFNWKYWNASEKYYQHHAIVIMPQSSQWKKRLIVWQRLQFSRKFWHKRYNTHAFVYSLRFHMSVLPLLFVWCALKCILHSSTCRPIISQGGDTDRNANTFTERVAVI